LQPAVRYLAVLYGGTYLVANVLTSLEEARGEVWPAAKTTGIATTNALLGVWKDSAFARMFGSRPSSKPPARSLAAWCARDFIAMGGAFVVPSYLATNLQASFGVKPSHAEVLTQVSVPVLMQPITAPLALYGFVAHNHGHSPWSVQFDLMRKEVLSCIALRSLRIFPPYCAGGVVNRSVRSALRPAPT